LIIFFSPSYDILSVEFFCLFVDMRFSMCWVVCWDDDTQGRRDKCGDIPLKLVSEVGPVKYKDKKHCFALVTAERIYHVCADDDHEMNQWVAAINRQRSLMNSAQHGVNIKTGSGSSLPTTAASNVQSGGSGAYHPQVNHLSPAQPNQPNGPNQQNGISKEVKFVFFGC
jgi:hypothetical protein